MSGVFKFVFDPHQDYDEDMRYNRVEVSGGTKEDNICEIFERFVRFLEGCGYKVDRDEIGYVE